MPAIQALPKEFPSGIGHYSSRRMLFVVTWALAAIGSAPAQTNDTTLVALHAQSFFFNVVGGKDGRIYAGSSDGVFEMRDTDPTRLDDRVGYVKMGRNGKVEIDSNGIRYIDQKTYLHLLPYPSEERDETHAMSGRFLYIASGGRMHVFEIRPYGYSFRNHSIRSFSKNLIATYSGIYHRGRRLPDPTYPKFSDGNVREYNGKVFIPFDSLNVYDVDPTDSSLVPYRGLPPDMNHRGPYDIRYSPNVKKYFIATESLLLSMDSAMKEWKTLHVSKYPRGPVVMPELSKYVLLYASGRELMAYNLYGGQTNSVGVLPEAVMDGGSNGLDQYILCPSGLYSFNRTEKLKKVAHLSKAHTLLANRDGEFLIGTDAGLMHYDIGSGILSTLVKGVEFNRRALALENNRILAGSINGLYTLDNDRLKEVIKSNAIHEGTGPELPGYALAAMTVLLLATLGLAALYLRTRRRYEDFMVEVQASAEAEPKPRLTREDIEDFIRSDLTSASLKSIKERFKTNNVQIYSLLDPEKPGQFIQRLRMEIVQEMRSKGSSAKDIAQKTGLSESYIKRVWNR